MRVFARVVELGGFARAAEALDISRARASEIVATLERELGARLLHRTTRRLSLTDDGRAYHERCLRILADLDEAEELLGRGRGTLRGRLRVAIPIALARHFLVPALPGFLARQPELALEIRLENRLVDLIEEGVDCAVSYGAPVDGGLVARRIGATHLVTCASPAYLSKRGTPLTTSDLAEHHCIVFLALATGRPAEWLFERNGTQSTFRALGNLAFNSMEACVEAAVAGIGVTQVLSSLAHDAIVAGQLVPILLDSAAAGPALYVTYAPNRHLSARIRAFAEFAAEVFAAADEGWRDIVASVQPHGLARV